MKEFDYKAAIDGAPVQTRDGRKARIICWDKKGATPMVALVDDGKSECAISLYPGGKFFPGDNKSSSDIVMAPIHHTHYVALYRSCGIIATGILRGTEKEAEMYGREAYGNDFERVVKIEWDD